MRILVLTLLVMLCSCSDLNYLPYDYEYRELYSDLANTLEKSLHTDSDRDGVVDYWDHCEGTPSGVITSREGCPLDLNGNGSPDYLEVCDEVQENKIRRLYGCAEEQVSEVTPVYEIQVVSVFFDFDSSLPTSESKLKMAETIATHYDELVTRSIRLEGHTDGKGSSEYNRVLSELRVKTVKNFLIRLGFSAEEMTLDALGESSPQADNDTEEGRANNRRVDLIFETLM